MTPLLPFRLGSTSYVYPDDILPNVRRLAGIVDDIELVLFEVDSASNLPNAATVAELRRLAEPAGMTYTVHLPLDLRLADPDRAGGSLSLEKGLRVIASTRGLDPYAYIVHLDGMSELARGPAADWPRWRADCAAALSRLAEACGHAGRLCIENLERYPIAEVVPVLDLLPVSLCLDVGHLWLAGLAAEPLLWRYRSRLRVIHLHGIGERDHQSLRLMPESLVHGFLDALRTSEYAGVVTLEVFNEDDFFGSRRLVLDWAQRRTGHGG